MREQSPRRGAVMMIVGILMIAFSIVTVVVSAEPLPVAVAVIGLVFVAVGRRAVRR